MTGRLSVCTTTARVEWQVVVSVYNQSKRWMTGDLSVCTTRARNEWQVVVSVNNQSKRQSVGDPLLPSFIVDMTPDWWSKLNVSLIIIIICHAGKAWAVMDCHFTWAPEVWIFFWIMLFGQDIQVFISMPSFCSFPIKFDSSHKVSSLSCLSG